MTQILVCSLFFFSYSVEPPISLTINYFHVCVCEGFRENILLCIFSGMLEDGHDDFNTSEDLYDAIGGILQGTDDSKTDDEIKNICEKLHSLMSL